MVHKVVNFYSDISCLLHKADDEAADSIKVVCDVISEEHTIYKLMTTPFEFSQIDDENSNDQKELLNYISGNTDAIKLATKQLHKKTYGNMGNLLNLLKHLMMKIMKLMLMILNKKNNAI